MDVYTSRSSYLTKVRTGGWGVEQEVRDVRYSIVFGERGACQAR